MLRGDEIKYQKDLSPYGIPHVVEEELGYVSYQDYRAGFKPKKKVCVGATVLAMFDGMPTIAKVNQVKKKPRAKGMYAWITIPEDNSSRVISVKKVIAVPALHEFVRQTETKCWFQVPPLYVAGKCIHTF